MFFDGSQGIPVPAIRADDLSKCYQIYAAPADRLKQFLVPRLQARLGRKRSSYYREFWALSGVSFEIAKGETIGIIGRNGSGKSTLLQIISGTLTPTSGSVETRGRVAALLELGAGFNPAYTGRENVYMNCSVLGLSREQIDERFADIVDFSEIRDFIDQPVKNYSSGMFARLAFSAAIHVAPDILIVDEALSVGDFAFQLKCVRRLKELSDAGCTILFVTHDIEQVQKLCRRALYLREGKAVFFGDAREACDAYLADMRVGVETIAAAPRSPAQPTKLEEPQTEELFRAFARQVEGFRRGSRRQGEIVHVSVNGVSLAEPTVRFGDPVDVHVMFRLHERLIGPTIAVYVTDETGQMIVGTSTTLERVDIGHLEVGKLHELSLSFENRLREGRFALQVFLADVCGMDTDYVDYMEMAVPFRSVMRDGAPRWAWFTPPFRAQLRAVPEKKI